MRRWFEVRHVLSLQRWWACTFALNWVECKRKWQEMKKVRAEVHSTHALVSERCYHLQHPTRRSSQPTHTGDSRISIYRGSRGRNSYSAWENIFAIRDKLWFFFTITESILKKKHKGTGVYCEFLGIKTSYKLINSCSIFEAVIFATKQALNHISRYNPIQDALKA